MTFSVDTGMLSMKQLSGSDTYSIVLASYTVVGGEGVFPAAVGISGYMWMATMMI